MRIQQIETFPLFYRLARPYGDANGPKMYRTSYIIRLTTNTGVTGWGECADWLPTLHSGFHERIIPFVIGKAVAERGTWLRTIRNWHSRAAAAVSMACTEIMAQACGLSVCDLWGVKYRNRVPVYASFQSYSEEADWKQRSLQQVEKALNDGFDKIKLKIGGKSVAEDQQHVREVQRLLSSGIGLALDANQSYDAAAALQWQPLLQSWSNLMWLEEPLPVAQAEEYALLRQRIAVPLAGGENLASATAFLPLLTRQALDIITPDPLHMAGIDEYRHTVSMARTFGMRAAPHAYDGALSRLYAMFAQACIEPWTKMDTDSIEPVEWDVMDNPFTRLVPLRPENGAVTLPEGTGIGVQLDQELLAFYQWDGSAYT